MTAKRIYWIVFKWLFVTLFFTGVVMGCMREIGWADETIQDKILSIARAEIGNGETVADNRGPDVDKYFRNSGHSGAWCGAFVSWVLNEADVTELGFCTSARQMFNKAKVLDWVVDEPHSGDLTVFWRNKKKSWQGHISIVERVHLDKIITIEGNKGNFPSKVKRVTRRNSLTTGIPKLLGYVRIGENRQIVKGQRLPIQSR